MHYFVAALALAAGVAGAPTAEPSYAGLMVDSTIRRGVTPKAGYSEATLYTGFKTYYLSSKNQTVYNFYRSQIDALVSKDGVIKNFDTAKHSLDNYRIGNDILFWYEQTKDKRYKTAAETIKRTLDTHPRTPTGGFWHRDPVYPNQMWLDGIYMADPFYAKFVSLFQPNNTTAWDDIALQFDNIDKWTKRSDNLRVHGYDESKKAVWADPVTGAAPLVWARAMGWYVMALLEVIPLWPKDHPALGRLKGYFQNVNLGLKAVIDEKGGWWNVMEKRYEDAKGNYLEASASAMFTYGMLRGLNEGLLTEADYGAVAAKAYQGTKSLFITNNNDGTINFVKTVEVGSLSSNASYEYYSSIGTVTNDPRGVGPFIVAAIEAERRAKSA